MIGKRLAVALMCVGATMAASTDLALAQKTNIYLLGPGKSALARGASVEFRTEVGNEFCYEQLQGKVKSNGKSKDVVSLTQEATKECRFGTARMVPSTLEFGPKGQIVLKGKIAYTVPVTFNEEETPECVYETHAISGSTTYDPEFFSAYIGYSEEGGSETFKENKKKSAKSCQTTSIWESEFRGLYLEDGNLGVEEL